MKRKFNNSKGVTLIALIITIIVLIILASVAIYSGRDIIQSSKLTSFTTEMKIMQTQVNDLYNKWKNGEITINTENGNITNVSDNSTIGKDLTYSSSVQAQATKVLVGELDLAIGLNDLVGYKYFDQETIQKLGIENVEEEFFIDIQTRSVVSYDGLEYNGTRYYTLEQLPQGLYNVNYDPSVSTPTFDVSFEKIGESKWRITISNIQYSGYINKWTVQYQKQGSSYWSSTEDMSFVVREMGKYNIKLSNGSLESPSQSIFIYEVNEPELLTGMTEIMFKLPNDTSKGEVIKSGEKGFDEDNWYDYNSSKWANAMTEDGSMWVWIPRYAYMIDEENQTIDVKFLIGTTDQYYNDEGELKIAKRVNSEDEIADTTADYYVHPAFTNETNINYANGGWDEELTGIWVAKFEAGYTDTSNKDIQKPVFQPIAYSINSVTINDSYNISRNLTNSGNIYGLSSVTTDSHLIKNSEWGAVAYLSWSEYGTKETESYVNNISVNNNIENVYAVTGLTTGSTSSEGQYITAAEYLTNVKARTGNDAVNEIYAWDQLEGQKASSTLNMYGIYDLSGGVWERTAGYIANGNSSLKTYGESVAYENGVLKTISTKYTTVYPNSSSEDSSNINTASGQNYALNTKIFGDAIRETSTNGTGANSWNSDYSVFPALSGPFPLLFCCLYDGFNAGLFAFDRASGSDNYNYGFRSVLVEK